MSTASVIAEVIMEREGQPRRGFTHAQDDLYVAGEIAVAASLYANPRPPMASPPDDRPVGWPDEFPYRPQDRRSNLIKAAAMLVAEIERIDRERARR